MMAKDPDPISEAVEKVRSEAYATGYRDGLKSAANKLAEMAEAAPEVGLQMLASKPVEGAPTVGTTPFYVWQAVLRRPGMTGSELIAAVKQDHKAPTASIRTSISRVKQRKLIVSRHGKWFPA